MMEDISAADERDKHFGFRVEASDRTHVYQHGHGYQFNVEHAYFDAALKKLPGGNSTARIDNWLKASELDPLELGVHRAAMEIGNAVPPYIPRDFDNELRGYFRHAARNGGFVILVGDSTAGKSRSAYEALREVMPDRHVFAPDDIVDFDSALVVLTRAGGRCIVWLDDFERFIGPNGMRPTIITHLRSAGVAVIATMRSEQYYRFSRSDSGASHQEYGIVTTFQRIINQGKLVVIRRQWTSEELRRAEQTSDRRIQDALDHAHTFGIAEYLAAGPLLRDEWNMAWGPDASPRGAALVAAAVDCARAGLESPLPVDLIVHLHEFYLNRAGGELLQPEPIEEALTWASRRRYGVTSLLIPTRNGSCYRAFEYLPDVLSREPASEPVPVETWRAVLEFASSEPLLLFGVAHAASKNNKFEIEEQSWRLLLLSGYTPAALKLGRLFKSAEKIEEAAEWFQKAVELGDYEGATQLGLVYEKKRQFPEAERLFRAAADAGNAHGMYHLGNLLRKLKNAQEAEEWFRSVIRIKKKARSADSASLGLASILLERGQLDEAETLLRAAVEKGQKEALTGLGILLLRSGRRDEAVAAWVEAAAYDVVDAITNLGNLAEEESRLEDAESFWRRAVLLGGESAHKRLAILFDEQGRLDEAEFLFRESVERKYDDSALNLATFCARHDRIGEAEDWALKAVEEGTSGAASLLAHVLLETGRTNEAERWLIEAAESGETSARWKLSNLYIDRNDYESAERWLLSLAESDALAACQLGEVLIELKRMTEAERWLLRSAEDGQVRAACLHGQLLFDINENERGEERLRYAFTHGHRHAGEVLHRLLAKAGRGSEAAKLLREVNQIGSAKRPRQRSAKRQKRRRH